MYLVSNNGLPEINILTNRFFLLLLYKKYVKKRIHNFINKKKFSFQQFVISKMSTYISETFKKKSVELFWVLIKTTLRLRQLRSSPSTIDVYE